MKSETEKRFDALAERYLETFDENYPLMITGWKSLAEACEEMEECLRTGVPAKKPTYEEGVEY